MKIALWLMLAAVVVAACQMPISEQVTVSPELEYATERRARQRRPVILIPGTLGSRLYNTENGEIAWGSFSATISELADDLALPISEPTLAENRDAIRAYRVLDRAEILMKEGSGEVRFYAEIIDHLTSTLGYRPAFGNRFHRGHDLFVFFYDWRRSNVEAAVQLHEFIENIRRDLHQPDQKFTFLCVSNGGMIARYYLKFGGRDVVSGIPHQSPLKPDWKGLDDCERVICLGTPHTGTIDALHLIHDGYAPNLLSRRYPPDAIFSFPAAFELLPEPGEPIFVGDGGETLEVDLWNTKTWEEYGMSVFGSSERARLRNRILQSIRPGEDRDRLFERAMEDRRRFLRLVLSHARRFRRAIAGPMRVPTDVILGVGKPTLARVGLLRDGDEHRLVFGPRYSPERYDPMAESMFTRGDGVVTRRSGLGMVLPQSPPELRRQGEAFRDSLASWSFTPMDHREMFEDEMLRLTLAELLSRP